MRNRQVILDELVATSRSLQQTAPNAAQRRTLGTLTRTLVDATPDAKGELERYLAIQGRRMPTADPVRIDALSGKSILVTGGTGCIGQALMRELQGICPSRIVSVARGTTRAANPVPGVEYLRGDTRDAASIARIVAHRAPDVIFHLAAQRDPSLAESEVRRTIATNVIGTRNVVAAARESSTTLIVYASSGKAMRPFTSDVYTATKRLGEWVTAAGVLASRLDASIVRFTHVVDNAIILSRLVTWCKNDQPIRLFGPNAAFYVQSATEAAQALVSAALEESPLATADIYAQRDMGAPISLTDLAVGMIAARQSRAAIYFAEADRGYEHSAYAGLYDPTTAVDVGPMLNAFEVPGVIPSANANLDRVGFSISADARADALLERVADASAGDGTDRLLRRLLGELSLAALDATLREVPLSALSRVRILTDPFRETMVPDHLVIEDAVKRALGLKLR